MSKKIQCYICRTGRFRNQGIRISNCPHCADIKNNIQLIFKDIQEIKSKFEKDLKGTDLYTTRGIKSRDDLIRHIFKTIECKLEEYGVKHE